VSTVPRGAPLVGVELDHWLKVDCLILVRLGGDLALSQRTNTVGIVVMTH